MFQSQIPRKKLKGQEKGDTPMLNIIQYIPSTFNRKTAGLTINQQLKPLGSQLLGVLSSSFALHFGKGAFTGAQQSGEMRELGYCQVYRQQFRRRGIAPWCKIDISLSIVKKQFV
ncbi:hypothetical protein GUJ93_ZPchr0012g21173 [Zizania palustris]|uniref:Uncharacterized protein n=1 Tax=Zizania palustris TaxID=103762 RepID=A0A8J5WVD9_ZIZPA|nr:hypothetical protein GUJ93_ZPchr0012g21173 [Zizania palustris]